MQSLGMPPRRALLVGVVAATAVASGCGSSGNSERPDLTVSAAASLKRAFTAYGQDFTPARVRLSFAGSDALAAQIQQGVRPDVYAAANTTLPAKLHARGLVDPPVVFAANRLVLAVPAGSNSVHSLADLRRPGVKLVIGSPTVPVGIYTRKVLSRLPAAQSRAILANVRSNEPDVEGIVAKLVAGAGDAGFVYITDVDGAGGKLRAIELPAAIRPRVAYGAAVVRGAPHPAQARAFIAGLLSGDGRQQLLRAGFEAPPGR
jgi:molybdate transport system substrate-binding protein